MRNQYLVLVSANQVEMKCISSQSIYRQSYCIVNYRFVIGFVVILKAYLNNLLWIFNYSLKDSMRYTFFLHWQILITVWLIWWCFFYVSHLLYNEYMEGTGIYLSLCPQLFCFMKNLNCLISGWGKWGGEW